MREPCIETSTDYLASLHRVSQTKEELDALEKAVTALHCVRVREQADNKLKKVVNDYSSEEEAVEALVAQYQQNRSALLATRREGRLAKLVARRAAKAAVSGDGDDDEDDAELDEEMSEMELEDDDEQWLLEGDFEEEMRYRIEDDDEMYSF